VVLLSGGLDSSTLLYYVVWDLQVSHVHALSFSYGQKHDRELEMARWQAGRAGVAAHTVVDIGFFGSLMGRGSALVDEAVTVPDLKNVPENQRSQPSTYVPNRNLSLLSLAAAYAEAHGISDLFYGAQAQDEYGYWDCTEEFVSRVNHVFMLNRRRPVTVHAPFVSHRKADLVKMGLTLGVDYAHTWTCYRGGEAPCGGCPSCVERAAAFRENGVSDPLVAVQGREVRA
jgi:7-cyano-7-deazaguanine synthase